MRCERVEVEELVMRVPGVTRADAPALAEAVMKRVHERLRGSGRVGRLHVAELRVRIPSGLRRDELADRIADRIAEVLR